MSERISAPRAGHTPECASQTYEMREGLPVRDYCDCKPTPAPDDVKLPEGVETAMRHLGQVGGGDRLRAAIAAALEQEREARDAAERAANENKRHYEVAFSHVQNERRRADSAEARVREMEAERHAMVRVFLDGNSWCALVGPDLQEGVAGFGVTPAHALTDLAENLMGNPWPEDDAARQAAEGGS